VLSLALVAGVAYVTVAVVAVVNAVVVVASRNHTADPVGAVAVNVIEPAPHLDCVVFTVGKSGTALIVAVADFNVAA